MLFMISYETRNERRHDRKFVNQAANEVEATRRFMDWFFESNPGDAVRLEAITTVELTGDFSAIDSIEKAQEAL